MLALERFIKYLKYERQYSDHTVTSYKSDLSQYDLYLRSHLEIKDISKARHVHVRSWIVYLMQADYTAKSINRKLSTLKSYYKFLKKLELVKANPAAKITGPKLPKRLPTVIREKDLHYGLDDEVNEEDEYAGLRDKLIIQLLYQTGVRRAELIGLKVRDVDHSRLEIKVLGKGNKERLIPITKELALLISEYLDIRENKFGNQAAELLLTDRGNPLYPKFVYNKVKNWLKLYSTSEKLSPHVLRHSFATHLANKGAELNAIKELLGHSSLAATQVYMHNSVDRLKKVYASSHPRTRKKR